MTSGHHVVLVFHTGNRRSRVQRTHFPMMMYDNIRVRHLLWRTLVPVIRHFGKVSVWSAVPSFFHHGQEEVPCIQGLSFPGCVYKKHQGTRVSRTLVFVVRGSRERQSLDTRYLLFPVRDGISCCDQNSGRTCTMSVLNSARLSIAVLLAVSGGRPFVCIYPRPL